MKHRLTNFIPTTFLLALALVVLASPAFSKSECISCHEKVTPRIVQDFLSGEMGMKRGMITLLLRDLHEVNLDIAP